MNYDSGWDFNPPTTCNLDTNKMALMAIKPYTGPFTFGAFLQMPSAPNHKKIMGLMDTTKIQVPTSFSWRDIGQDQIEKGGIRDQKNCGGCWAFSSVSVLGDRFSLANQVKSPYPSSTWLISENSNILNQEHDGCQGGNTYMTSKWLEKNYNKLESCWPFEVISSGRDVPSPEGDMLVSPNPLDTQSLSNCCFNCCGQPVLDKTQTKLSVKPGTTKYFGVEIDNVTSYTQSNIDQIIRDIQIDIMTYGPVTSSFSVYSDFMTYWRNDAKNKKVYMKNSEQSLGGHAIVLTGWGVADDGTKYWEVRNSWGNTGDGGYCRFAFSNMQNQNSWCGIDIPLITANGYFGGVVSFLPNDLENLNDLISKGIFTKSSYGNLLNPSGPKPSPDGPKPSPDGPKPSGSKNVNNLLLYIGIYLAVVIILIIFMYFIIKK